MSDVFELIVSIPTGDLLGECVVWDGRTGEFLWTDILGRRLHRYDLSNASLTSVQLHGRLCSFGLTARPGLLIAAFDREVGWLDAATGTFSAVAAPNMPQGVRLNDGRVGPDGAFWVGSMVENAELAGGRDKGCLFRLAADGTLTSHLESICISNGLCWSPDGSVMYHADSGLGRVSTFPFNPVTGEIRNAQPFIEQPPEGTPDGAAVDAQGLYYSALWEGKAIGIFSHSGRMEGKIDVPASEVTCAAFGGAELDLLAVTSARVDLSEAQLEDEPEAGNLFIYASSRRGFPERLYGGYVPLAE